MHFSDNSQTNIHKEAGGVGNCVSDAIYSDFFNLSTYGTEILFSDIPLLLYLFTINTTLFLGLLQF